MDTESVVGLLALTNIAVIASFGYMLFKILFRPKKQTISLAQITVLTLIVLSDWAQLVLDKNPATQYTVSAVIYTILLAGFIFLRAKKIAI